MKPKVFFGQYGEDGMEGTKSYKYHFEPKVNEVEVDEILVRNIKPTQEELEYLIAWGEVARALEYAERYKIRVNPLKFLISRVVRYCIDTNESLVEVIQKLFWKETI